MMEWSIGESAKKYSPTLVDSDGKYTLNRLTADGSEKIISKITITKDKNSRRLIVEHNGTIQYTYATRVGDQWWIHYDGRINVVNMHEAGSKDSDAGEGGLTAPMPGTILEVQVKQGQRVREGQTLLVMEAMKMEHRILAPKAGEVIVVNFEAGDRVDMGATLVELGE
jgi:3-methylcrotonyl-CoA carboxylase alpha subunit